MRKGYALALQLPRKIVAFAARKSDFAKRPPIFCNSMPKSGTHLIKQLALGLSQNVEVGAFIASMPSITQVERSKDAMLRRIRSIIPGELVLGHMFYEERFNAALEEVNAVHFFLYRDPRDIVISEAHYLRDQNKWHRMHKLFAGAANMEAAITLSIRGGSDEANGLVFASIAERYSKYLGWLTCSNVFCVRYEDLVGNAEIDAKLREMAVFYHTRSRSLARDTIDEMTVRASEAIKPGRSHTFRKGVVGGWRNELKPGHIAAIKEIAGPLLIKLGYEFDLDW